MKWGGGRRMRHRKKLQVMATGLAGREIMGPCSWEVVKQGGGGFPSGPCVGCSFPPIGFAPLFCFVIFTY